MLPDEFPGPHPCADMIHRLKDRNDFLASYDKIIHPITSSSAGYAVVFAGKYTPNINEISFSFPHFAHGHRAEY